MNEFKLLRQQTGLTIKEVASLAGYSPRTIYRWEKGESTPRKAVIDMLHFAQREIIPPPRKKFTFIDLFAGIGGLRQGFDAIGGQCIFTSEWNKYSVMTYRANYPNEHDIAGDITKIEAADIPEHDVLLAGFPCQPFSIAGVSKKNSLGQAHGFRCDTQGTLFFDVARILEHHHPKVFLLENVKNLLNHDKGRTFDIIYETLTKELGYQVCVKVIDAKGFVPQHRERVFIVGFREKNDFSFDNLNLPSAENGPRLRDILHPEDGSELAETPYTQGKKASVSSKYTLTEHLWSYLQGYAAKHREKGNGFGFGLVSPDDVARTLSARYYKDGSEILIAQEGKIPRRLTPRECARLMGFDQPNQPKFKIPVSDLQAYTQFGNAVVVPVVRSVAKFMLPYIVPQSDTVIKREIIPIGDEIRIASCQ